MIKTPLKINVLTSTHTRKYLKLFIFIIKDKLHSKSEHSLNIRFFDTLYKIPQDKYTCSSFPYFAKQNKGGMFF